MTSSVAFEVLEDRNAGVDGPATGSALCRLARSLDEIWLR